MGERSYDVHCAVTRRDQSCWEGFAAHWPVRPDARRPPRAPHEIEPMTARLGSARTWQLAAAPSALAGLLALSGALEVLELKSPDLPFRFRGPRPPGSANVIIAIDEDSFDELNLTWPFPRALHARLLDLVSQGRPAAIGLDILFPDPRPPAP